MTISATAPLSPSFTRTGILLFKPFNFKKWCALGVAAWLTLLGEGSGGNGNFNSSSRGRGPAGPSPFDPIFHWMQTNVALVIFLAITLALLGLILLIFYLWLNSRGQFMLYEHIVTNTAEVKAAWRNNKTLASSLFKFRVLLLFLALLFLTILLGIAALIASSDWSLSPPHYTFTAASGWAIGFLAAIFLLCLPFGWVLGSFFQHMVIPVMYLRNLTTIDAIKTTWTDLFRPNLAQCLLYFLLMIVAAIARGIWTFTATMLLALLTCCTLVIISIIPLLGSITLYPIAVACLPVIVFERAYQLNFISQFGPAYTPPWSLPAPTSAFEVIPNPPPPDPQ